MGRFPRTTQTPHTKTSDFFWISGVRELRSYGVKELGSSDCHITNGGALQSGHTDSIHDRSEGTRS